MLVDPRGPVHATSGILPAKQIDIPPDQYAPALRNLGLTFLAGPVLTPESRIHLPLPREAGYQWSWLTRPSGYQWASEEPIAVPEEHGKFTPQQLVDGWLRLSPQLRETSRKRKP